MVAPIYRHAPLNIFIIIFHHHTIPSNNSIILSSLFTIICTIGMHYQKIPSKKSIKGNLFLHYQVFHQENPKENHPLHNQIFHHIIIILFHQFFSSPLRAYLMGGKSEQRTMHKAPHRIYLIFFHPTDSRGEMPRTVSSFDEGGGRCVGKFHETVSLKGRRSHNKVYMHKT